MHFSRARLRGHRDGQLMTPAALGERVGLTSSQVEDIEAGWTRPTELQVHDLADALGVAHHELQSDTATWHEDYVDAVMRHAKPLERQDITRAAETLHRLRSAS